jgi:anti-anti-sigma factor
LVSLPHDPAGRVPGPSQGSFVPVDSPLVAPHTDSLWYLRVEEQDAQGVLVIVCQGRVSNRTCPALDRALTAAPGSPACGVVLDLSGVDYISSSGLRAVERAAARLQDGGRAFVVCGLQDAVSVTFGLAGLTRSVAVEPSQEFAIARARGSRAV